MMIARPNRKTVTDRTGGASGRYSMLGVRRKRPDILPWLIALAFIGLWLGWDYPDPARKDRPAQSA
jgi:hypothetical protein